jgi:hypothetical protein
MNGSKDCYSNLPVHTTLTKRVKTQTTRTAKQVQSIADNRHINRFDSSRNEQPIDDAGVLDWTTRE